MLLQDLRLIVVTVSGVLIHIVTSLNKSSYLASAAPSALNKVCNKCVNHSSKYNEMWLMN